MARKSPAIETLDITEIRENPSNPRVHNPRNISTIVDNVQFSGVGRSGVIDEENTLIAGHGTKDALIEAGIRKVLAIDVQGDEWVVVRRRGMSREQKRAMAIADNRANELSGWDPAVLREELAALGAVGIDATKVGFDAKELAVLLAQVAPADGLTDPDEVPEPPAVVTVQHRQIFALGPHRVMCGDATSAEDVAALMAGERADLLFTDPPYGVDYDGGTKVREKLENDHDTAIYFDFLPVVLPHLKKKAASYIWHAGLKSRDVQHAMQQAGLVLRAQIIWNKNQAQFGAISAQYKQKHEPCFYAHLKGASPHWYGPKNEVTVWDCNRAPKNEFHPTQKPVELAERALRNSTKPIDRVLDCFGGSGSTLIGCERMTRVARVMEKDPQYVHVIIDRWEAFTGNKAQQVA